VSKQNKISSRYFRNFWFAYIDYFTIVAFNYTSLQKGNLYAAYFDESIQGLEVGSSVKYRGINVGRVKSIEIAKNSRYIEVVMEINKDFTLPENTVAKLTSVGITGFIYVELDLLEKNTEGGILIPDFVANYEVIPTVKSDLDQIMQSLSDITREFKSVKVSEIADNINNLLNTIQEALGDIPIAQLSNRLDNVLKSLDARLNETKYLIYNNTNANYYYEAGTDTIVEQINIESKIKICDIKDNGVSVDNISVSFMPPEPVTRINSNYSGHEATIVLCIISDTSKTKTIKINNLGRTE